MRVEAFAGFPYVSIMSTVAISDFLRLTTAERLQLVEDLWDSIAADAHADPGRLPVSDVQRREIVRRSEAYRQNPGAAVPLERMRHMRLAEACALLDRPRSVRWQRRG